MILAIALVALIAYLAIPLLSDVISLVTILFRRPDPVEPRALDPPTRLLFLVPAHNEEELIEACVTSLQGVDYPREAVRIVVIADNCTDRTAEIVRSLGAEVVERDNLEERGKPYAIMYTLERVGRDWDAFVIIDADTEVVPEFARALHDRGPLADHVVQAQFAIRNPGESWLTRLADILNWSTYRFRYPLKRRAGLNSPMTGNGMCIGRDVIEAYPWETTSLTENWELYARYTTEGVRIDYCRDAVLLSQEAKSLSQGEIQRNRWTAGRYAVLGKWRSRMLGSDRISAAQKLDCAAELGALSPVMHLAAALVVMALTPLAPEGWTLPLALAAGATLLPHGIPALLAFAAYPAKGSVVVAALRLPWYLIWRTIVFVRTIVGPRREWTRSGRHIEATGSSER
jgi:cellulose synthase/poly-beta-1,6-N-acetylglucosamine synthase-like glycosyltransferase